MFYTFDQNNSGGYWKHDKKAGIGPSVAIEAASPAEANIKAQSIGIYFDGCESGQDCECCGDRWSALWDSEKGSETPMLYGKPLAAGWGYPAYVHHRDGTIEERA